MKLKKKIFGILSLIVVIAITVIANSIPNPASAEELTQITHEIVVSVYDKFPEITIEGIKDNDVYLEDELLLEYKYSNASRIEFEIINSDGTIVESWVDNFGSFDPTTIPTGTGSHLIDLSGYGFDDYTVHLKAYGGADTLTYEDSFVVKHYAVQVVYIGDNANGEPVFDIYYRKEANQVEFDLFSEDGRPLFDPVFTYPSILPDSRYYLIDPTGAF